MCLKISSDISTPAVTRYVNTQQVAGRISSLAIITPYYDLAALANVVDWQIHWGLMNARLVFPVRRDAIA